MSQQLYGQVLGGPNVLSEPTHVEVLWGTRILDDGFTSIPNFLIRNYRAIGIEHGEWGFICTLLSYKHDTRDPYPEQETLAMNLGVSVRQVRKWTDSLVDKGLIQIGRRRHTRNKQFGTLVYNFLPLINRALTFLGDQAIPAGAGQYEVVYGRNEPPEPEVPVGWPGVLQVPAVPQVPVGEPAVLQVPDPAVPQVPLKIKRENKKNTTTTTTNACGGSKIRIFVRRHVTRDSGDVTLQAHHENFEQLRIFDWEGRTTDSQVQSADTLAPQAKNQAKNVAVPETPHLHEIRSSTQTTVSSTSCPASSTAVAIVDKPSPFQSTMDPYCEIETSMQVHMGRPYIAKQKDYIAINELLVSGVPLDWILDGIDRVFASRPESRERIRGFGYVAEVLKDEWACELAKQAPVEPIDFENRIQHASYPKSAGDSKNTKRPTTDPYTARPVRDERYEAFYRLFPNE